MAPRLVSVVVAALLSSTVAVQGQQQRVSETISLATLRAKYLHFKYAFEFGKDQGYKQGRGEMFLWRKDDGHSYLHTKAETHSELLGNTQITMVADTALKRLFLKFSMESLHKDQCLWYPFPEAASFPQRMALIRKRMQLVLKWEGSNPAKKWKHATIKEGGHETHGNTLEVQWTKSNILELLLDHHSEFSGIRLKRGERTVKTFRVLGDVEHGDELPAGVQSLFEPPGKTCTEAAEVTESLAQVQLRAPHQRSSVLNDLLLVLTLKDATPEFVTLSAMALPGDTSLLISDPNPPQLANLGGISFGYNATVYRNNEHESSGFVWMDLSRRAFHIYGKASHTVLGDLELDFIGRQQPQPLVYANIGLPSQGKHQCLFYDYPQKPPDGIQELKSDAALTFEMVDSIEDEDCVIFKASLARGRELYVWVDTEQDDLHAILRVEVRHGKELLRRANIYGWHKSATGRKDDTEPEASWGCSPQNSVGKGLDGQIAEFGMVNARNVHKRSMELLDALYAVRKLPGTVAVLELLALPGDVSMTVAEPELPELWTLPGLVFNYTLAMPFIPARAHLGGYFAIDFQQGLLRMTAGALGTEKLDLAISPSSIDVQITPVVDLGKCPNMGIRAVDRCWYLSRTNENCNDACAVRGLAFAWTYVPESEPVMPNLLGEQPGIKQKAWGRLECYVRKEDRYHPAQATADPSSKDTGDPGNWKTSDCELACPCSPMVHAGETECLSVSIPHKLNQSNAVLSDAKVWSFDSVGAIGEVECNRFSFPTAPAERGPKSPGESPMEYEIRNMEREADRLVETNVELWYSEEDSAAHRITMDRKDETLTQINITGWKSLKQPPPMDVLKAPVAWNCRSRDTAYHPWLELASSRQVARLVWEHCSESDCPLPASAALWQLAEATGVLGLLSPIAQDMVSRLVAWPAGRLTALQLPHGPLVDMFGADLQSFSFSFSSVFPAGSPSGKRHGVGEIRVDLKNRRLSMRSEAHNVSSGVPLVESHIIYLGNQKPQPLLLLHTQISDYYQQCWSVKGEEEPDSPKPQPNPFARAQHVGSGFSAPTTHHGRHDVAQADKYHFAMGAFKNVDLFVDEKKKLIAMNLNDLKRHTTSSVAVQDWSTDPIDEKWFELNPEWYCADTRFPQNLQSKLAEWDLLSFFFPHEEKSLPTSSPMTISGTPSLDPSDRRLTGNEPVTV